MSYGEGITYWPVVEVVKRLGTMPKDEAAASAIRSLLRRGETETNAETIAWAFRKLLEQEAQKRPSSACSTICTGARKRSSTW